MADKFTIEVINGAVGDVLSQVKQADANITAMLKKYEALATVSNKFTSSQKASVKATYTEAEKQQREFDKRSIAQDKERLKSMSKNDKDYFATKQAIKTQELNLAKNLSDQQRAVLKQGLDRQIADEKAKYAESVSLANKLQSTLESVFQRAVFYTAIYKGISQITGAIDTWITVNIELDYALGKVNTISDVTVGQMAKILDISELTGRSVVDLTNALYEINSANIKGADAMRVMEVSTRAAVGGFTSAEDAADTLTDVLNAYKLSTSQTEEVSDKLLKAVEIGKLKWEEYHGVLGRILPSAYQLGVSLDELLGSLSTLTLSGLKFNEATVGMRNIFMKMLKPTKDMDIALANLNADLGTSYTSIQDVLKVKGVIGTLQLLGEAMKGTDLESSDLFNTVRGLTAQLSLMSDAGAKATEITAEIANSTGQTNKVMGIMSETIVETKNRMIAAWQALGVESFGFGEIIKWVYDKLADLAKILKSISPLIVGMTASVITMAGAVGILGVKFLATTYALPALKIGLAGLSLLFGQTARNSVFASAGAQAYGTATQVAGLKAIAAAAGVSTFTVALAAATMGLSLVIGAIATYVAWSNKTETETQKVAESTKAMKKAFDDAKKSTDLLNKIRPFAGWDISELTKQIENNNNKIEKRQNILDKIVTLEARIASHQSRGWDVSEYNNQLIQAKNELHDIGEITESELQMYQDMNRELEYKKKNLTNIQALIQEIVSGTRNVSELELATLDINALRTIKDNFKKELDEIFFKRKTDPLFAILDVSDAEMRMNDYYDKLNNVIAQKEAEGQKIIDEEKAKELKKQKDFWQKYYEAYMNATHEGRLALIEEQRKSALAEAKLNNETNDRILWLNRYYDNLILEEKKKHNEEITKEAEKLNKKVAELAEKRLQIEQKFDKMRQESDKQISDALNKQYDDWIKERESLRDTYYRSESDKQIKFFSDERKRIEDQKDLNLISEREYKTMLENLEKNHNLKMIEIWQEQHEFQAWAINSIAEMSKMSIETILDEEATGAEKRQAIWKATKDLIISSFAEMVSNWIKSKLLQLTVEKTTAVATIATNAALTKSYLALAGAKSLFDFGRTAAIGAATYISSLAAVTAANAGSTILQDAIVQDGKITPFRKDDVVAIGTNMYGTRSGYGTGTLEAKLDKLILAVNAGTLATMKQKLQVNVDPITPAKVNDLNRQGEKINRRVGYATT